MKRKSLRLFPAFLVIPVTLLILLSGCSDMSVLTGVRGVAVRAGQGGARDAVDLPGLVSLSVGPADLVVPLGSRRQLVATGTFGDGSVLDVTASVSWYSTDPLVADVSSAQGTEGVALAVGKGMAILTASSGVVSASTSLTVRPWSVALTRPGTVLQSAAWSGDRFVAVGGAEGSLLTSPEGESWEYRQVPVDLESVTWSGTQFVALGPGCILTSPDGMVWTSRFDFETAVNELRHSRGKKTGMHAVAWSGTRFVVVGSDGMVLTSPNGEVWAEQTRSTLKDLYAVVWAGTQFVAVGASGTVITSPDGIDWAAQGSGTSDDLFGVAWSGSSFAAVGWGPAGEGFVPGGSVLTSPDGVTWSAVATGIPEGVRLSGVAACGTRFVAVGGTQPTEGGAAGSAIMCSPDGVTWTSESVPGVGELSGISCCGLRFIAVGEGGTILTGQAGEPKRVPPKRITRK